MVILETSLGAVVKNQDDPKLVRFCDIQEWYSLEEDIEVEFIIDTKVKGSTSDWIGLFREDWNTFDSYIAFQRGLGKAVSLNTPRRRKVTFPFKRELISSVLLDFHYQFVYVDKYLDVLGTSPLFRFTFPLKYLHKEEKSIPGTNNSFTLSEELLLSEGHAGEKNVLSSCKYHRHPMYRNTVTTCSHCRPCGHDYFNIKEKVDMCYAKYLCLSERMSYLESQVGSKTLENRNDDPNIINQNIVDSANELILTEAKIKFTDAETYEPSYASSLSQSKISHEPDPNLTYTAENHCSDVKLNKGEELHVRDADSNKNDSITRQYKKESMRSSSFPQDNWRTKLDLYSTNNQQGTRKCYSDGKLAYNDNFSLCDVDSPMILKAIIGHQEQRIRRLTQLLNEQNIPEELEESSIPNNESETSNSMFKDENVVKLVRTEQRMLAQILRINNNCEEFSNEVRRVNAKTEILNCLLN